MSVVSICVDKEGHQYEEECYIEIEGDIWVEKRLVILYFQKSQNLFFAICIVNKDLGNLCPNSTAVYDLPD